MSAIQTLSVNDIRANDYNPNFMTDEGFSELVAEVRHLGQAPKPIIVRPNGRGYVIVDGEHGWRAAKEAGFQTVSCEIVDVDDFEARRQTYKRNQHGTHDPVRLGQMFAEMMKGRDLSQRALAKEMEVSDGTIRNALLYSEAAKVRNGYAFQKHGVREVRTYLSLPHPVRDYWLDAGTDINVLDRALRAIEAFDEKGKPIKIGVEPECWEELVCEGFDIALAPGEGYALTKDGFVSRTRNAFSLLYWAQHYARRLESAVEFAKTAAIVKAPVSILGQIPIDGERGLPARPLITTEQWRDMLTLCAARQPEDEQTWLSLVKASVRLQLRADGIDRDYTDPRTLALLEYLSSAAPDFINDANIDISDKVYLTEATADVPDDVLREAKREAVRMVQSRDGWLHMSDYGRSLVEQADMTPEDIAGIQARYTNETIEKIFADSLSQAAQERKRVERDILLQDDAALLDRAVKMAGHKITVDVLGGRPVCDIVRDRLAALPAPEGQLLCGFLIGEQLQDLYASWLARLQPLVEQGAIATSRTLDGIAGPAA